MSPMLPPIGLLGPLALAAVGYLFERRNGQLPNWLTFSGVVIGLAYGWLAHDGLSHLASFVAFAVPLLVLFRLRALGAGGVKLISGAGAMAGLESAVPLGGALFVLFAGHFAWARSRPSKYSKVPGSLLLLAAAVGAIAVDSIVRIASR